MSVAWRAISETVELMQRLRAHGHALFCLSNMHPASLAFLERTFTFLGLFAGRVISCRVGLCKPEPAIYRHLLARYGLVPDDTIFVAAGDGIRSLARRLGHWRGSAETSTATSLGPLGTELHIRLGHAECLVGVVDPAHGLPGHVRGRRVISGVSTTSRPAGTRSR
jgi:hypothetical protein